MLKGSDQRLWVERLLPASASRAPCCRYGGLREVFDKVFDQKIFALCKSVQESTVQLYGQLTVNFSRVNCGTRIDAREAWCVSTEALSELTRCMMAREARVGVQDWVSFKCYAKRASIVATQRANAPRNGLELRVVVLCRRA